jgi:hypothetical protein
MASFGENLRRERELRGIGLREIAEATKISVRFLQALEQDRLDILPGGLFPRAFVRQYAKHLGLDAERLVAEFVYAQSGDHPPEKKPEPPPRHGRSKLLGLLILAVLAAGSVLALRVQTSDRGSRAAVPAPAAPSPIRPGDRVYPPPSAEPSSSSDQGLVLTLSARQSCWVAAQVDGATVLNRILIEGETQTIEAQGEIVLSVGNAGGLSFSVNNRQGVALGRSGEVRRNIVITPGNLDSLLETTPGRPSHSS